MAFDGIVTKSIVTELNQQIVGGKINKVFEPNKNEIILGIYNKGKNYALNCSISVDNYRINLTTKSKPNPLNAPNFCMLLRKHLIGGKIKNITMRGLERIVILELECYNELNDLIIKKLVVELMGKHSNIILLNDKSIIIVDLPGIYSFTKTEPEDMIYRIDFNPQKKEDLAGYHQMFADYGWEYLQDMNEYSYFRKPADVRDEDIYSDNDSRLDMIKRILRTKMLPFMILLKI